MPQAPLADTVFFLHGESAAVTESIAQYLEMRGAETALLGRLEDLKLRDDVEGVLVVHYSGAVGLAAKLPLLKKRYSLLRVLLLHEFVERGRIDHTLLAHVDHMLEKPFSKSSLEKALTQFGFHPLTGKNVFLFAPGPDTTEASLLARLGATVLTRLPDSGVKLPIEIAVLSPESINPEFRELLQAFRAQYPEVPCFMLYDAQAPGVLDAGILNEIAYLVQKPVARGALRQKLLAYFEQPQQDRRKNPRKKGISQVWISAFNIDLGTTELFESPFLIDVSQSGLSFQTYVDYAENQLMAIWVVSEEYPDKILDLRGHIRWKKSDPTPEGSYGKAFKYGVEFIRHESEAYLTFARMIAMH
jgi:hypothetical protein